MTKLHLYSAPPEDQIIAQEDLYRLAHVWGDLDERTQYLLSAKYILKKSGKEIAGNLNMPSDNVRTALVRARRKAREAMGQAGVIPTQNRLD